MEVCSECLGPSRPTLCGELWLLLLAWADTLLEGFRPPRNLHLGHLSMRFILTCLTIMFSFDGQ
jgi:hypothetical protein